MDTSKNKVKIPPPKFHDFTLCRASTKSSLSNAIWEIGVPAQHSLSWSIVLSYLYLSSGSDFKTFLEKLTGDEMEVNEIKKKKKLDSKPLDIHVIEQQLKGFNPFKNKHAFFHQAKEVTEVFRIFDLRLKRFANKLKKKNNAWNDDFKLNAASLLLECEIEVHFPNETTNEKIVTYPKSVHTFNTKIILFQYENKQLTSGSRNVNIFRFGMPDQQAISRKIDALKHFLKIAKISSDSIAKVRKLMDKSENHGKYFLTTILENECSDILQNIYRSPYIALKISQAGFETDPLICSTQQLSVFAQSVLWSRDSKYLFILYDYASNCHSSVRRANDNVLESLNKIKNLLEKDVSELSNNANSSGSDTIQRSLNILKQYITYTNFQINIASDLNNLKKNFESSTKTEMEKFELRKSVIESILAHYQNYFYFNLDRQLLSSMSISDKFSNYLHFSHYYKNVDNFGCISFFDNFYQLRLLIRLKQENVFLNIEWKMFAAILFNNYFSECNLGTEDNLTFDEKKFQDVNVLRHVPLLHRDILQTEISAFLGELKNASDSESLQKFLKSSSSRNDSNALPHVIDLLLKIRVEQHMQAALEVSPGDDGIKSILVIERALQVIGESIKPPSLSNSIISFLLRSCLSDSLQNHLKFIRNDLSHKRCNSVYKRLETEKTEKNFDFFKKMQKEIAQIKRQFEIVFFTQFLIIQEWAMFRCIKEIGKGLSQDVRKAFYNKYTQKVDERVKNYEKHHGKCVELLFDTLCDLQKHIGKEKKHVLMGRLKAINYLLKFITRHTISVRILNNFKTAAGFFVSDSESKEMTLFEDDLRDFLSKWINVLKDNNIIGQNPLSVTVIESFSSSLKLELFSTVEKVEIKTALLCAYDEAIDASNNLKGLFKCNLNEPEKLDIWLSRVFIPSDKIVNIRDYFNSKSFEKALHLVKNRLSEEQFQKDIEELFQPKDGPSTYFVILLTKITYQRYLKSPIYTSAGLSDHIAKKLEFFLTKNVHLLISRMESLKNILLEDEEIQGTWIWGKSEEIKNHLKFLMRQRYITDVTVRASLDMAFLDCVNILHKPFLSELYEKSTDLFSGIDLRNVLSHRTNIPEVIGGILDEDDFPSTMIDKMLELIDDVDAVKSTLELLPEVGILEEKNFVNWIQINSEVKYKKQVNAIKKCDRWKSYLFLFPFIRN